MAKYAKFLSICLALCIASQHASGLAGDKSTEDQLARDAQKQVEVVEKEVVKLRTLVARLTGEYNPPQWTDLRITGTAVELKTEDFSDGVVAFSGGIRIDDAACAGLASQMGMRKGDVIVGHNGTNTPNLEVLREAFSRDHVEKSRSPKLLVLRDGVVRYAELAN